MIDLSRDDLQTFQSLFQVTHVRSTPLLRRRLRTAAICSWLHLNSRQISGWNSQELIWQDDIMPKAGLVSGSCKISAEGACMFQLHFWKIVLRNDKRSNVRIFLWNKKKDYASKERSSGLWNEVRAESSCTRREDLGWFWGGANHRHSVCSWVTAKLEVTWFNLKTVGSTTQKYDNLRHGHALVTVASSAQACFFSCFPFVKKPVRLKLSNNDLIVGKIIQNL